MVIKWAKLLYRHVINIITVFHTVNLDNCGMASFSG